MIAPKRSAGPRRFFLPLFLLSAATLAFEITLTRLFSVAQFYHFAFMIVSIALLGFGASGTALTVFPKTGRTDLARALGLLALGTGFSILVAYLGTNLLPFDSFSIAWDRGQLAILVLHYLALATPFFFTGMTIGLLLEVYPAHAGRSYAVNLLGSAFGCVLALLGPGTLGAEGTISLSAAFAALAVFFCLRPGAIKPAQPVNQVKTGPLVTAAAGLLLLALCLDLGLRIAGDPGLPFMALRVSPYKDISYALQYPNAQQAFSRWNAFSRVDLVRSQGIHSIPGLSYRYLDPLPRQDGLLVDGGDLNAVLPVNAQMDFSAYLPSAVAFQLRPGAQTLVLEPRGGLNIRAALALGARHVTAVEGNPLIVAAAPHVYDLPQVELVLEQDRTYLGRESPPDFDLILLSLTSSYHPVRSGAYSLAEDYRYTVEAFQAALERLHPDGIMVITRWLQDPPSESLRAFGLAIAALERMGADPREQIVAYRGYNTLTLLLKREAFSTGELSAIREFAAQRAFDLVFAPGLRPEQANRYNILPEPLYYRAFMGLLAADPRQDFYRSYPFNVRPPTDDRPFFGHYFKWSQAGQIMAEFGHTWQPFGGAGYFVILALLILATLAAGLIILLPLAFRKSAPGPGPKTGALDPRFLLYFCFIGLAFLLVEIPLLQHFILYLGNPAYALTAVLFSILLFSALGSRFSQELPHRPLLLALVTLVLVYPYLLTLLINATLGTPLSYRLLLTALSLAPLGFLMGIPFPAGIKWMQAFDQAEPRGPQHPSIPWAWAANGAASVISSVLAALMALTFGFSWVLRLGALFYLVALLTALPPLRSLRR